MLCKNYLGKSGVVKHLQTEQHLTLFLGHCFPSVAEYLNKFLNRRWDDTLKLIATSFVKTLTIEICREITKYHIADEFCPLLAHHMSGREFNSTEMMKFVVNDMPHVYEADFPETKKAIDEAVKKFILKSKQLLAIAGTTDPTQKNAKVQTDERKVQNGFKAPNLMSQTELERMKVAINIAMELTKNGLQISPSQLEDSVKSYYKYELQKSMADEELEVLEALTVDDLKLLLENFESLCEDEQNKLKKYLTMLKKIEDKNFKLLISNGSCAKIINDIIEN
jgi:hypothetical protein